MRFYVDLKKLNNKTTNGAYSLPWIDTTLNGLQGSQQFSSLDLKPGHLQVEKDEERKPLTAFALGLLGFYGCERIPFMLANAPVTFQQLVDTYLEDLNMNGYVIYIVDIVIYSKDPASHLVRLEAMLQKLENDRMKLKLSKYELFCRHST